MVEGPFESESRIQQFSDLHNFEKTVGPFAALFQVLHFTAVDH
jgi:hypothetical protein